MDTPTVLFIYLHPQQVVQYSTVSGRKPGFPGTAVFRIQQQQLQHPGHPQRRQMGPQIRRK